LNSFKITFLFSINEKIAKILYFFENKFYFFDFIGFGELKRRENLPLLQRLMQEKQTTVNKMALIFFIYKIITPQK